MELLASEWFRVRLRKSPAGEGLRAVNAAAPSAYGRKASLMFFFRGMMNGNPMGGLPGRGGLGGPGSGGKGGRSCCAGSGLVVPLDVVHR